MGNPSSKKERKKGKGGGETLHFCKILPWDSIMSKNLVVPRFLEETG